MDVQVRDLDDQAYRELSARAALEGRTVGELIGEAIQAYLDRRIPKRSGVSLRELRPEPFPKGNERLSSQIDAIVYR